MVILADKVHNTISNIHGVVLHPKDGNFNKGIFLGCFLGYLRSIELIDAIAAGGSGGSLAIGYFKHVLIPKFVESKQAEIAQVYHNDSPPPSQELKLTNFVDWHRLTALFGSNRTPLQMIQICHNHTFRQNVQYKKEPFFWRN